MPDDPDALDLAELRRLAVNVETVERLWHDTKPGGLDDAAPAVRRDTLHAACLAAWEAWEDATLPATIVPLLDRLASAESALTVSTHCGDSHYAHWDAKGTAGTNCPACQERGEANALAHAHFARHKETGNAR